MHETESHRIPNLIRIVLNSPAQIAVQEWLNSAVHDTLKIPHEMIRPSIFHALVRVKKIVPNLRSETDPCLVFVTGCLLLFLALRKMEQREKLLT